MSNGSELAVSYDVSNEFFALWLDKNLSYSCALFEGTRDLEQAQTNKLSHIADCARVTRGSRVLDVGCGWGAALRHLAQARGASRAVGVTLSRAQYDYVTQQKWANVDVHFMSFTDLVAEPFDAVVSIGMFEHLATPAQARAREHLAIYRKYFEKLWQLTKPGAWFGLQTVIGGRVPRDPAALRELGFATYSIFPGAISPRVSDVIEAASGRWEVMELRTRREHYEQTTAEWLRRLRNHRQQIEQGWGLAKFEEYERYLSACVMAFGKGYQSLAQLALRRIDQL